jgi:ribose transport system substrate-binding protein
MKRLKRVLVLILVLLMLAVLAACQSDTDTASDSAEEAAVETAPDSSEEETAPAEESEEMSEKPVFKIGYIQASSDAYYQMQADAAKQVVDHINMNEDYNVEMTVVLSEGQAEKELAHIEDFIAQDYDAIIDFTFAAETAQRGAQLSNEAGMPFFVVGSTAADGPGKVTSTIKGDFGVMGGMIGSYIADNYPDSQVAIVEGALGQGIVELFEEGFEENLGPGNAIVQKAPADWNAEKAQNIMNDWLTNYEGEFDMVYAMNADIYLGVVRALEDAGLLNDPIKIITHNGRPEDFQGVMDGKAIATNSNSPTYESGVLLKVVTSYLLGEAVPELVITPSTMVDIDTPENLLGWELDKGVVAFDEYVIGEGPAEGEASAEPAEKPVFRIGYIQASSDAYYQMQADAAKMVVDYINENEDFEVEMTVVLSEGQAEKELAHIEDFIAQDYDAIIDFTFAAETAQRGAQLANEAGTPFFVVGSTAADGPGKVTSTVKGDFGVMGGMIGSYIADNYPDAQVAIVEGALGQGIVELFEEGFEENLGAGNEIVQKAPADWNAEKAQNIMNDWLTNYDGEFDMVYAMNADIYLGVVRALEDAGLLNDPIRIITHNGRPEDFQGVMDGKAIATNSNSPTYESGVLMKVVTSHLLGEKVPVLVITPSTMVDIDTPENLLGWEVDKGVVAYQEYVVGE